MKSEKAKQHIARNVFRVDNDAFLPLVITRDNCNKAVELAEQEAEERMQKKAITAYCQECGCRIENKCGLEDDCLEFLSFIQKLNENEND